MSATQPIFIPGVGSTPDLFAHQVEVFESARVHALPGQGAREMVPLDSVDAHARELLERIDPAVDHPVVVGHDLGAAIALEAALIAPERIAGLVLICSGAWTPGAARPTAGDERSALIERVRAGEGQERIGAWLRDLGQISDEVLAAGNTAARSFDRRADLARVRVPSLVLGARDDRATPPELVEELARGLNGAVMIMLDGCGKLAPLEQPQAVNLAIAGYLARLEVTGDLG